ncbi:MAG: ArsA family ATPase [Gammaproteobacteria bacterium]|nr:MAG: ArsA family ATPase [Gammaproteobacteria bacterium]
MLDRPVLFFAGKGGVGKTTCAALTALAAARAGERTLLVSTDPAHNLGDLFGPVAGGVAHEVSARLDVLEIDPVAETRRYLDEVKGNMRRLVSSTLLAEAERQVDLAGRAPGAEESALLERMVGVLLDERVRYRRVIFDTAPTGHTLRLLTMPSLMGAWVDGLLRRRAAHHDARAGWLGAPEVPEDPVFELLHRRRLRLEQTRSLLADRAVTGLVFVLVPEALPIAETRRGIDELADHGLAVAGLVVNRVMPTATSDPFYAERKRREREYLARIDAMFADLPRIDLPLLAGDVDSVAALEQLLPAFIEAEAQASAR